MRMSPLKITILALAIAGPCGPALAGPPAGSTANAATNPAHHPATLPAALRPALYQALAKDASTHRIGQNGCAALLKQRLKACFDNHGARFSGAGALTLRLTAYGRKGKLATVEVVKPTIQDNRVSYMHGDLTGWWRVLPIGFEQGFTIAKRPAGHGELMLALAASRQDAGAPPIRHSRESGNPAKHTLAWGKLRYGKLVVTDAKGKVIPSSLKTHDNRILITVNDAHAAYPLTVDPLVWLQQKITPNDVSVFSFGTAVAVSGGTAVIGSPFSVNNNSSDGAAYIFTEEDGKWVEQQKLIPPEGIRGFGASIAFDGTTILVGAPPNDYNQQGAVYVFTPDSDGVWTQTQTLTVDDAGRYSGFGNRVAVSASYALVSAATEDFPFEVGAVYVFTKSNGAWIQTQKISGGETNGLFGYSLAISGTTALIGEPGALVVPPLQGAAYIFTKSNGNWVQTGVMTASDGCTGDHFGKSVALDGLTAIVGAAEGCGDHPGAAYVFKKSGGAWIQTQKLVADNGAPDAGFGRSVAMDGPTAVIGAIFPNITPSQSAIYIFMESNGAWVQTQMLTVINSDEVGGTDFGSSLSIDKTDVLTGDSGYGNGGTGAAFFYGRTNLGLAISAPSHVNLGNGFVTQAIATNDSSAASPAVAITMAIPAAASFISANATQGSCGEASGAVTCDFGAIDGNAGTATANITFKATGNVGDTIRQTAGIAKATPALTASASTTIATNNPPVASDGTLTTNENTAASGALNATDADGDSLTFGIVDKPNHGSVTLDDSSTGAYTYTPNQGFSGSDSFTFKANDGQADSNTARISITVKAVSSGGGGGGATGPLGLGLLALAGLLAFCGGNIRHRVKRRILDSDDIRRSRESGNPV